MNVDKADSEEIDSERSDTDAEDKESEDDDGEDEDEEDSDSDDGADNQDGAPINHELKQKLKVGPALKLSLNDSRRC